MGAGSDSIEFDNLILSPSKNTEIAEKTLQPVPYIL